MEEVLQTIINTIIMISHQLSQYSKRADPTQSKAVKHKSM